MMRPTAGWSRSSKPAGMRRPKSRRSSPRRCWARSMMLRGLHSADRARIEALAASRREHLYEGLLTVLLRLVFLLYAEDRDLIPSRTDGEARALYDQGYGVRTLYAHLLDDAAHYPDTMEERRGQSSAREALSWVLS